MELIENLLQLLTTFVGALLSGISYRKSHRQGVGHILRPAGAAGSGGKAVRFPPRAEEITE